MPLIKSLTCDACGKDVMHTDNCEDYRLALIVQSKSSRGGAVTLMAIRPPIDNDAYFCGVNCLRTWLEKKHPRGGDALAAPTINRR